MSAQHALGQQFQQLDMFRPAHELLSIPGDFPTRQSTTSWAQKLHRAQAPQAVSVNPRRNLSGPSLQDSIREHGIHWPVQIDHGDLGQAINDGHHRVAAAHDLHPNYLVPVQHRTLLGHIPVGGAL